MDCSKRHGGSPFSQMIQPSFEDCMNSCGKLVACHSVDYSQKTKMCYYSDYHSEPTINGTSWMSAYSMGCAGACATGACQNSNRLAAEL